MSPSSAERGLRPHPDRDGGPLSVREAYRGKHVLITGTTGFVGKVWLTMMLELVPDIGRIYVLVRGKGRAPRERFERVLNSNPAFRPLHERLGPGFSKFLDERLEVVAGDIGAPDLGLDAATAERLRGCLDLLINSAGLVDFNPDVRDALESNVDGALNCAAFARSCGHAALLHVSTCYVAGTRNGVIAEDVRLDLDPRGEPYDAEREYADLRAAVARLVVDNEGETVTRELREQILERLGSRGQDTGEARVASMLGRMRRQRLKAEMTREGTDRALAHGWPNTYTYVKAMAEDLLVRRHADLRLAIVRPAIVESALQFPFAGWNEGFNTSGPLAYLVGTWFRHVPAKRGNPFDVVPVDQVAAGMAIVGASLMADRHALVYHAATSSRNRLTIDRAIDLCSLYYRRDNRLRGKDRLERLLLSRWDAVATTPEHLLNMANIRSFVHQVGRFMKNGLPTKIPKEVREAADKLAKRSDDAERRLRKIEDVLELFVPFTHDNYAIFVGDNLSAIPIVEPEFQCAPERIDWRSYWLDVHLPGLRRWCFPDYEGEEREMYQPTTQVSLQAPAPSPAPLPEAP
jgi:long-chain acyl-CoA synthetase